MCGLIVAAILILKQVGNLLDDDPETVMSVEMILGALGALGIGVCARDNGVSSKTAGAKLIMFGLCCLFVLGGCGGVNLSPQYENQLAAQVAWSENMADRANVEPTLEGCVVGEFTLPQVREVFEINRVQWLMFWEASQGVAPGE